MKVIKLGGSLLTDIDALTDCLKILENDSNEKTVIVPGGGVFAEQVRIAQEKWRFDDLTAHNMAILAMQQMALLFASINKNLKVAGNILAIQETWLKHSTVIWFPEKNQINDSDIEASWNVTSDSLAAWLANQLNARELILVKSVNIQIGTSIQILQEQCVVDKAFSGFVKNARYKVTVLNKHRFNEIYG